MEVTKKKFEKKTKSKPFDTDDYMDEFKNTVQKLDFTKGELKRDLIDYNELKELDKEVTQTYNEFLRSKLVNLNKLPGEPA